MTGPTAPAGRLDSAAAPMTGQSDRRPCAPLDAWRNFRNRLVADPRFRRLAAALPFSRLIAEQATRRIFDLCAGFTYSQTLFACVELGILARLADRTMTAEELAPDVGLSAPAMERLLAAAAALGIVEPCAGGRYGLGLTGTIIAAEPGLAEMISHHRLLYADLADPVALLRGRRDGTRLSAYWAYAGRPAAEAVAADTDAYTTLMGATQASIADAILDAYDFSRHRRLLDVAGGDGSFAIAAMQRHPRLAATTFDLPCVAARAEARIAAAGLSARGAATGGDFITDPLPGGHDVATLVRVALDHDEPTVARLLRAIHAALPRGGTLVIAEPIAGTAGAERITDTYFGLYLLAMGGGRTRTFDDFRTLLKAAGFVRVRRIATRQRLLCGLVVAQVGSPPL
ncbi:demethylspheroidene O-methyltransferase [Tepidamorphus gemmatus]|uniref:Demethylspheroidene O-methyltransferase n=2 Tax=Tepidamorphus gemmatus TaxID=747076 RepID=A0A4R3M1B9_9HYPH|nr:demethylspheroidene O-methyltransferase [Tepidamorphus gemmatus]